MKFRFIEYAGNLYIVIGLTYLRDIDKPGEYFEAVILTAQFDTIWEALLAVPTVFIKLEDATEITDRNKLENILILYG